MNGKHLILRHNGGTAGDAIQPTVWVETCIVEADYGHRAMEAAVATIGDLAPGRYMAVPIENADGSAGYGRVEFFDVAPRTEYDIMEVTEGVGWPVTRQLDSAAEDRGELEVAIDA